MKSAFVNLTGFFALVAICLVAACSPSTPPTAPAPIQSKAPSTSLPAVPTPIVAQASPTATGAARPIVVSAAETPWWMPSPTSTPTPITPTPTNTHTPTVVPTPGCVPVQPGTGMVEVINFAQDANIDFTLAGKVYKQTILARQRKCVELPFGNYRWNAAFPGYGNFGTARGEFFLNAGATYGPMFICINHDDLKITDQCNGKAPPPTGEIILPNLPPAVATPTISVVRP